MASARLSGALQGISVVLIVLSPVVLYFAVTQHHLAMGASLLLVFALVRALPTFLSATKEHRLAAMRLPLVAVASAAVGVVTHEGRALLVLPSVSQFALALVFLSSLRTTPLVEHFARMESPRLGPFQRAYCRIVTLVWGVFLSSCAALGLYLAFYGSTRAWAGFSSVGVYIAVAVVFGTEYTVRRILFRDYKRMPFDRLLARVFPPYVTSLDLSKDPIEIPKTYIFFKGHFEGRPILPGVTELTEILVPLVRQRFPEAGSLVGLRRVRFRRPILPGDKVLVTILQLSDETPEDGAPADQKTVRFELRVGAHLVSNGAMLFAGASPPIPAPEIRS